MNDVVDIGNIVVCDLCGEDFTLSDKKGGIVFQSSAYCPDCTRGIMPTIILYNEKHFIIATANPDETFKDFVLRIRNGNNTIQVKNVKE